MKKWKKKKESPELVSPAGQLRQNAGPESELVVLTPHHHTGADEQLLHLWSGVESDVVCGHETRSLIFKPDFVLQPPIVCEEQDISD